MLCPICKKPVDDAEIGKEGSMYPFCSDRCRLIDLGRWLSGKYQIPTAPDEDQSAPQAKESDQNQPKTGD